MSEERDDLEPNRRRFIMVNDGFLLGLQIFAILSAAVIATILMVHRDGGEWSSVLRLLLPASGIASIAVAAERERRRRAKKNLE
jgi:hypothetical protein